MPRKYESALPTKERIKRELEGEKTGFDELLDQKRDKVADLYLILKKDPRTTRKVLCKKLNVSMRTVTRYLQIIKGKYPSLTFSRDIDQVAEKNVRKMQLRVLVKNEPTLSKVAMAKRIGVSDKTLSEYLKEMKL